MLTFQKLLFEARRHGKGEINDKRTPQLSWSIGFQEDDLEVDYLPMFKTVGDPTSDDNTKLSAGIVAYRNQPYKGANMRVELYHAPYEHMAGDAYSY
jgi:hypothetical protein